MNGDTSGREFNFDMVSKEAKRGLNSPIIYKEHGPIKPLFVILVIV